MMITPELLPGLFNPTEADRQKPISLSELKTLSPGTDSASAAKPAGSFQNLLGNLVGEVAEKQAVANDTISDLMSGKNVSLHQAMISMEEASVSFQLMVEVRNQLLDSYQELMRMQ
ncbi:MAG TPA: flagellar hook-basal body complex protein FliE, partial [Verrucomicrobiae bacterium]|nr:flagellar hook-basal body complex protein FliE [Verrucomicrobiae bacterium]